MDLLQLLIVVTTCLEGRDPEWPIGVAAQRRQELVRTLDVRFQIEIVEENREQPIAKTTENRLVLDGDKLALDVTEPVTNGMAGRITRLVYDGQVVRYRYTHQDERGRRGTGGGVLETGGVPAKHHGGSVLPLIFAVRGADPRVNPLPLDKKTWTAPRVVPRIFHEDLLMSEHRIRTETDVISLWCSPAKDYSVVAFVGWEIQVEWHPSAKIWLPKSWTTSKVSASVHEAKKFQRYTVTSVAINQQIPADAFDFQFPPGIQVTDLGSQQSFVVGPSGELTPTRPAAPTSTPQESVPRQPTGAGLLIVGAAFGVLVALLLALRYRSRRDPPPHATRSR